MATAGKGESAKQVAIDILRHAGTPLPAKEIAHKILASGRCVGLKGKTPEATISACSPSAANPADHSPASPKAPTPSPTPRDHIEQSGAAEAGAVHEEAAGAQVAHDCEAEDRHEPFHQQTHVDEAHHRKALALAAQGSSRGQGQLNLWQEDVVEMQPFPHTTTIPNVPALNKPANAIGQMNDQVVDHARQASVRRPLRRTNISKPSQRLIVDDLGASSSTGDAGLPCRSSTRRACLSKIMKP